MNWVKTEPLKHSVPLSFRAMMFHCFFVHLFILLLIPLFTGHLLHIHYVPGTVVTKKTKNHQSLQTDATSGRCRVTGPIKSHWKLTKSLPTHLFIHLFIFNSLTYSFYKYSQVPGMEAMASSFSGEVPKRESPDPTQVGPRSPPLSLLEQCRNEPATFVTESPLNTLPTKHPQVEASGRVCNAQAGENIASPPSPVYHSHQWVYYAQTDSGHCGESS